MKILSALKKIKHIDRKIEKNMARIEKWSSYFTRDDVPEAASAPAYSAEDIRRMIQQVNDWSVEKMRIRAALHRTNVETRVDWHGQNCSIDELLLIRTMVLPKQVEVMKKLRRKEKGSSWNRTADKEEYVVLQYDPKDRDRELDSLDEKMREIDAILDEVNIETEVIGL